VIVVQVDIDNANGPEHDEHLATMRIINKGPSERVALFPDERIYRVELTDRIGLRVVTLTHHRDDGWERLVKKAFAKATGEIRYER